MARGHVSEGAAVSEYRFWGINADGSRDLFGMAKNCSGMGEALDVLAAIPREGLTYTGFEIEKYPPDNKLSAVPHVYPDDAYPDRHPRGSYWATTIGWDILDRLPPGRLDNAERAYLCGLIGGALSKERGEK